MRIGKWHILRWLAVAFAALAVATPAALADPRGLDDIDPSLAAAVRQAEAGSLNPDDRPFSRGLANKAAPASPNPDDRRFARSVRLEPAPVLVKLRPRVFDWRDAAIGGAFGVALALLGTGAILMARRRPSTLRAA